MLPRLFLLTLLLPLAASAQLAGSDLDQMLDGHNGIRADVANGLVPDDGTDGTWPTATDMIELIWDDDLATVAQGWTDQCQPGFNANRTNEYLSLSGASGGVVGETSYLFVTTSATPPSYALLIGDALQAWLDQSVAYHHEPFDGANVSFYGMFTQVIWADTTNVGCGIAQCAGSDYGFPPPFDYAYRVICDYYNSGNFQNFEPYESGPTASHCPSGYGNPQGGLCTLPEPGALAGLACGGLLVLWLRGRRA